MPQHLVVVLEARAQAQRDGEQPRRLRRQVEPLGVRAADDRGELVERRIVEPVLREERIEAAPLADVRELDPRHVVGDGAGLLGDRAHPLGGTNRNSGSLSMKRAISHGQAMRSMTGRARVTHFMSTLPRSAGRAPTRHAARV